MEKQTSHPSNNSHVETNFENIPGKLKSFPQWVTYKSKELVKGEKPTKIPIDPKTGKYAKTNDPQTWGTFEDTLKSFSSNGKKLNGIGFVVSNSDPITGIDLDHCRNPQTGIIEPWALSIVEALNSYGEITPSGTGLRIFVEGKLPENGRKKGDIEAYSSTHFLTVTGWRLDKTPATIEERQKELDSFYQEYFGEHKPQEKTTPQPSRVTPGNSAPILSDQEIREKASQSKTGDKFKKLMEGNFSDYHSWSEADLALCSMLAFWTGNNPTQIDSIFRQSGLMRDKWDQRHFGDGRTYGQSTIEKAIEGTTETYTEPKKENVEKISVNDSLLNYNWTDAGNAEAFKQLFSEQWVFIPEKKKWFRHNGINWEDDTGQAILRMLDTVRQRGKQAWELQDIDKQKAIIKWCLSSESKMKLSAALSIAEPMMSQSINSFDADSLLLCCSNGAVNLRTGNLIKPKREDWLYRSTNILYNAVAKCDRFLQFLDEVFNNDKELINFIQKAVGYLLTGLTIEQVLFILYGTGANGKSVFLNLLGDLLGDYSVTTPASTFKDNPYYDGIPNDVARIAGARVVTSIEIKEGTRLNEERIKAVTGGDRVTARFLHNEFFEFTPACKFCIAVNHKPIIRGSDEAIWRRIRLIPFQVFFPPERRDLQLYQKLRTELPGILSWAVEGCLKWQKEGLEPVGKVKEWTDNYRAESDLIAQFLEEKTSKALTAKIKASDLYRAYESWCKEHGEFVITGTKFGKRMEEKGFSKKKTDYVYYLGIELI